MTLTVDMWHFSSLDSLHGTRVQELAYDFTTNMLYT